MSTTENGNGGNGGNGAAIATTTNEPATNMLAPIGSPGGLRKLLNNDRIRGTIGDVVSKYVTPDKLFKLAILAATQNPTLFQCTGESIVQSLMVAGQMGLEISPNQGHLVPYNQKIKERGKPDRWALKAQFIPDYRGLVLLAKRAGAITKAEARLVYLDDKFEVDYGADALSHIPNLTSDRRSDDDIIAVYFRVKFPNGDVQFEIMTKAEVDDIRDRCSKAKGGNAWADNFGEMAKKTVTKRGMKYIAVDSPELAAAIEHDNRWETGEISSVNELLDTVESVSSRIADQTADRQAELRQKLQTDAGARAADGPAGVDLNTVTMVGEEGGRTVPEWERETLAQVDTDTTARPSGEMRQGATGGASMDLTDPKRKLVVNGQPTPFFVLGQQKKDRVGGQTLDEMRDACTTIGIKLDEDIKTNYGCRPEDLSAKAAGFILAFLQGRAEKLVKERGQQVLPVSGEAAE